MKLTKLYIHNYKSFYDTTIELDKMNIVVGENNSGKSNLIDVLEFIDIAMTKDVERAIKEKGGYSNIKNYNTSEEKIVIRATFEHCQINANVNGEHLEGDKGEIIISFSLFDEYQILSICMNMMLIVDKKNQKVLKFILSNKKYYDSNKTIQKLYSFFRENQEKLKNYVYILFKYLLTMAIDSNLKIESRKNLYIKTYAINTENIRKWSHKRSTNHLKKDGSNLGQNLFNLNKNNLELISNSMIGIVNEIDGIDIQETFGNYLIGFHEKNKSIGIDVVSDGTINLLATITALNQDDKSILLAFDEPERYLHLKAVNYLLESFRASEKQILITTHSTEILKYANLDEIVFIYRDSDGDTQSIRARDIPDLEGKMERLGYERPLTLDELIASNIVGNFE